MKKGTGRGRPRHSNDDCSNTAAHRAGAFVAASMVLLPGARSAATAATGIALTLALGPLLNYMGLQEQRVPPLPERAIAAAVLSFIASCMLGRLLPSLTHQTAVTAVRTLPSPAALPVSPELPMVCAASAWGCSGPAAYARNALLRNRESGDICGGFRQARMSSRLL
jgi:hypothetical protein